MRAELRDLAIRLQPALPKLVGAATFAVIASALDAHTREAARRGWSLPQLSYDAQGALNMNGAKANADAARGGGALVIEGMWPYWLGGAAGIDPGAVKNSFTMEVSAMPYVYI